MCTAKRRQLFADGVAVEIVLRQLQRTAHEEAVAILAYCFMPDHLHLLVQGLQDETQLTRFAKVFRQRATVAHRRRTRTPLWQAGYFERVLRGDDQVDDVARYIAGNPVRAGLVKGVDEWPFTGGMLLPPIRPN